jgi:hypothetical protein
MSVTRQHRGRAFGFSSRLLSPRSMLGVSGSAGCKFHGKTFSEISALRVLELIPYRNRE